MESEKTKEIKKALECCSKGECEVWCPRFDKKNINHTCQDDMNADALTLINELEKENKKYKRKLTTNQWVQEIRKEALKQFAERLKGKLQDFGDGGEKGAYITEKYIYETLKEFINE